MKVGKYVVISTCGSNYCNISCKGVTRVYTTDTLKKAKGILDDIMCDLMDNITGIRFEKNIPYSGNMCECDSIKHSVYFFGDTMAWIRADSEDWERVEIFKYDEESDKYINLSMP